MNCETELLAGWSSPPANMTAVGLALLNTVKVAFANASRNDKGPQPGRAATPLSASCQPCAGTKQFSRDRYFVVIHICRCHVFAVAVDIGRLTPIQLNDMSADSSDGARKSS
jgi:hypothetical protein